MLYDSGSARYCPGWFTLCGPVGSSGSGIAEAHGAEAPGTGETVAEVRFAQKGISEVFRYGEFAGRTIDEVATGLKAGIIAPSQLPIQVIERGGGLYTLNNRSLMALRLAGVAPTLIRNVTGHPTFEAQLTQRLMEIGRAVGEDFVPMIRRARQP